jgi:hypothetical protein
MATKTKTSIKLNIGSKFLKGGLKMKANKVPYAKNPKGYKSLSGRKRVALLNILSKSK